MQIPKWMDSKTAMAVAGSLGGAAILGGAAVMIWNSKQARAARMLNTASRVMFSVGTALRSVSGIQV